MSTLDSLIRLNRFQLDEQRRQLAELDALALKLRQELGRLADERQTEQAIAAASTEAATAYGRYARTLIDRRQKLEQSIASVDQQIVLAREALSATFREVKRYETAAASREAQAKKRVARQQQQALDEMGIEAYRRRAS